MRLTFNDMKSLLTPSESESDCLIEVIDPIPGQVREITRVRLASKFPSGEPVIEIHLNRAQERARRIKQEGSSDVKKSS